MLAQPVVVLKHLLIGSHVEITFKLVQIAICKLAVWANYATNFDRVTISDMLCHIVLTWFVVDNLDLFVYKKKAQLALTDQ